MTGSCLVEMLSPTLLSWDYWVSINSTLSTPGYHQRTFQVKKYCYHGMKSQSDYVLNKAMYSLCIDGVRPCLLIGWSRGVVQMANTMRPRTDPRGTPYFTSSHGSDDFLMWTVRMRPVRYDWTSSKFYHGCQMTIPMYGVSGGGQSCQMPHWAQVSKWYWIYYGTWVSSGRMRTGHRWNPLTTTR